MNHLQGFCFPSLQFCALWIGGLGSKETNASIRIPNMVLLTWKLRLPPGHVPQNQWAKKRVTLLAVVIHPENQGETRDREDCICAWGILWGVS